MKKTETCLLYNSPTINIIIVIIIIICNVEMCIFESGFGGSLNTLFKYTEQHLHLNLFKNDGDAYDDEMMMVVNLFSLNDVESTL